MQNDLDPKGLDYTTISRIVFECRERQKATGEGDQMLSRWISEALSGHLSAVPDGEGELVEALRDIAAATDPDNPESYRCDDREGCLDTVHAISKAALAASRLSQAGVRITDEMVERAARAMEPMAFREEFTATDEWFELEQEGRVQALGRARAALEAALSGDTL